MSCRERGEADKQHGDCGHGARPKDGADLKAVRTGIAAGLKLLHSGLLLEELPNRSAELLRQLDQQKTAKST